MSFEIGLIDVYPYSEICEVLRKIADWIDKANVPRMQIKLSIAILEKEKKKDCC